MPENRSRILIVGMADSVHLARWLSQFSSSPIDFVVFPSSPHRHIHTLLEELVASTTNQMTLTLQPSSMRSLALPLSALDIPFRNFFRSRLLRRLIQTNTFDLIHVLELQHAGYLLLDTKLTTTLPKVFITNWGSDIYWFEQFPKHKERIIQLLKLASYYSAECQRDIDIVRRLGYTGITMPVIPNSGGINLDEIPKDSLPASQRKKIMIKGYTGFVGQAIIALKACELAADHLTDYEVIIYSASLKTRLRAMKLRHIHKVHVTILKKRTQHNEMLRYFSESRIYIGISLSDGISTSLLEAMATGCYPIQTSTSCCDEWITNQTTGTIVINLNPALISKNIQDALVDDQLVDLAAILNIMRSAEAIDSKKIGSVAKRFYASL